MWSTPADRGPLSAEAVLKDKEGKQVGVATMIQTPEGVRIAVTGYRLPPGGHGLHVHAVGLCEPPDFTSAGAHFNPGNKQHGTQNPAGAHAGDLPNLVVAASGEGGIDVTTKAFTLAGGPIAVRRQGDRARGPRQPGRREDRSHRQQRRSHRVRSHHEVTRRHSRAPPEGQVIATWPSLLFWRSDRRRRTGTQ